MQELKLKMKGELDLITKERIAMWENIKMNTDGIADRLIALENNRDQMERLRVASRSEVEVVKWFVDDLDTLRHNVNQLIEAHDEIEAEIDLHFTIVDRLGMVESHMATTPGNTQLLNSRICPEKPKKTKASRLSRYPKDESNSHDEHLEDSKTEYESDSSRLEEEGICRRRKKRTKKEGLLKHSEDAKWRFKKRCPKCPGLKEIKLSNSLYKSVLS